MSRVRTTFAALSHSNYRLWFFGQMTSLFGTWMQSTAQGYLVYELTRSSAWLGYTGFASGIGMWIFTLYGGVIADRVPRRSLLVVTQLAAMILAFVLAALAFTGRTAPWHIIVLAFLLGVVNAFDVPARHSFVVELVGREDLTNAIALNSMMFNAAVAVGPCHRRPGLCPAGPGLVLHDQRRLLHRRDRRAARHADRPVSGARRARLRAGRHPRGRARGAAHAGHPRPRSSSWDRRACSACPMPP